MTRLQSINPWVYYSVGEPGSYLAFGVYERSQYENIWQEFWHNDYIDDDGDDDGGGEHRGGVK